MFIKLNAVLGNGRTNFGVYPPYGGRELSFPNPTANLVSTKREHFALHGFVVSSWQDHRFLKALVCVGED